MIKKISIIAILALVLSACGTSKATSSATTTTKKETTATKTTATKKEPLVIKSSAGLKAISAKSKEVKVKRVSTIETKKVK